MSRRRYLSTDISRDAALNRLAVEHGDFVVLLYTWMIPHAGDDGTIRGTAEEIMYEVMPGRRDKWARDIEEALVLLHEAGLIEWDSEGRVVSFPEGSFYKVQSYIGEDRRRTAKRSDPPPDPDRQEPPPQNSAEHRTSAQNASSFRSSSSSSFSPSVSSSINPSVDETTSSEAQGAAENADPVPDDGDVGIVLRHFPKIQKSAPALGIIRRLVQDRPEIDYEAECSHLEEKAEVDDHPLTRPATALDNWIRKAQFPLVLKEQQHIHGPPRLAGNGSPPSAPPLPASDEPKWQEALQHLEVSIGAGNVSSWLGEVAASIGDDGVALRCPDEYTRDWLAKRFDRPIRDALATVGLEGQAVKYVVGSAAS